MLKKINEEEKQWNLEDDKKEIIKEKIQFIVFNKIQIDFNSLLDELVNIAFELEAHLVIILN